MRDYPPTLVTDTAGVPTSEHIDTRSPARFLWWLLRRCSGIVLMCALFDLVQALPLVVGPWLVGHAVEELTRNNLAGTLPWLGWLTLSILLSAGGRVLQHRLVIRGWLVAMYSTIQLVSRRVTGMGHVLPRRVPTGEVLSVASSDADTFGAVVVWTARLVFAVVSFLTVGAFMISTSWQLGLLVVVVSPLLLATSMPFMRPLRVAQEVERSRSSDLTSMVTDIVAGLRILRGIGGEATFGQNYVTQSQRVREAAVRAGTWQAVIHGCAAALSGVLLLLIAWLGAQQVLAGELGVGDIVSFFGYALFMVNPVASFFEAMAMWIRGLVSAQKTIAVLNQHSPWRDPVDPEPWQPGRPLVDEASGLVVTPGELLVVAAAVPDDTVALADRLGRYLPGDAEPVGEDLGEVTGRRARRALRAQRAQRRARQVARDEERARGAWGVSVGGADLSRFTMADIRRNILVSDTASMVFSGTLQELVDPHDRLTRDQAESVMRVAAAEDIFGLIPGGWQGRIDERGRGLSGGQRQRLVLARALGIDPEVLVLVEPTSAVDAHTEARIADRLAAHRAGRTTVVMSASPLVLRVADRVAHVVDGRVVATGTHEELLHDPAYRRAFQRDMEEL